MRTGRPSNPNKEYTVIVHTVKGLRYASTKYAKVNADGKKVDFHKHWGRVLEGNKFQPSAAYLYADVRERQKLIFPDDWDMSMADAVNAEHSKGRPCYDGDDVDRQYGPTWLLNKVAEKTGLLKDLKTVFAGNMQMVDDVLTLAYYRFVENLSYNQLKQWQREVKAPSKRVLDSKAITYLAQSITEQHRMDLFRCRAKRTKKGELCAVDSTSISTYGFNIVDIRWGKNKEKLPLRQTLEVVVYSLTSRMPIYYKELPGNIPDSRTLDLIIKELEDAGFSNLVLITDRGYESMKNLETCIAKKQKVITSVKVGGGEVLKKIREIDMSKGYPSNMEIAERENLYYAQYDMAYDVEGNGGCVVKSQKYKLNLYFDPVKHSEAICDVQHAVREQSAVAQGLIGRKDPAIDKKDVERALNLLKLRFGDDGVLLEYERNAEKIDDLILTAGFFANKTLGLDFDAMTAKDNYGMRDAQEKTFALQKGPIGEDRTRAWSETAKHGRMFICFVALILASYVRSVYEKSQKLQDKFDSIEAVLAEMRTIRCIEHDGKAKFITPFVGAQREICSVFEFDIPEGCSTKYTSKRILPVKRGRKPKAKTEQQEF